MPLYEYTCQDCHANFEMIRSIKDADADIECFHCHGHQVKRQISLFNASIGGRPISGSSGCSSCTSNSCSSCGSR